MATTTLERSISIDTASQNTSKGSRNSGQRVVWLYGRSILHFVGEPESVPERPMGVVHLYGRQIPHTYVA